MLLANTFLVTFTMFLFNPYLVVGVKDNGGLGYGDASVFLMVALLLGSFISLFIGVVSSFKTFRIILLSSSILSSLSFYFMMVSMEISSGFLFLLGLICLRISLSCSSIITRTMHMLTNSNKDCTRLFSLAVTVFGAGSSIAPIVAGWLYSTSGFVLILKSCMFLMMFTAVLLLSFSSVIMKDLSKINIEASEDTEICVCPNQKNFTGSTICLLVASVVFFCLLGQSLSYIPMSIVKLGERTWIPIFFTTNAIILTFFSVPVCAFLDKFFVKESKKCSLGVVFITLSLLLIPVLFEDKIGVVVDSVLYSIGEIVFSSYSLNLLKTITSVNKVSKITSIYTFLTTSVGLGFGQYLGVVIFEKGNNNIISFVWFLLCLISLLALRKMKNEQSRNIISVE